ESAQIRCLVDAGGLQLGLFDERNLFEFTHPDYPGERLLACRNPHLAKLRAAKRAALLAATATELDKVRAMVAHKKLAGRDKIGVRVGRVINKYKAAKHFTLTIEEDSFAYRVDQAQVKEEAALDGIYVLRTPLSPKAMGAADVVRSYKSLSDVERAFRCLKTVDLKVRPIFHWLADRVRAHIFLCMLAYYVEWHMREKLVTILFDDHNREMAEALRESIVAPAERSPEALAKDQSKTTEDGLPVHSLRTLLIDLGTLAKNLVRAAGSQEFYVLTQPTALQRRALDLLTVRL